MGKGNAGAGELEAHDLPEQQQDNNSSNNSKGNSNGNWFWSSREDEGSHTIARINSSKNRAEQRKEGNSYPREKKMKIQQHLQGRTRKTMQLTRGRKEKMAAMKLLMKMVMMVVAVRSDEGGDAFGGDGGAF